MKCLRKQKMKAAVRTQHGTHKEDSRLILHVFQTIFWYMRLCGLVLPFTCSHDPQLKKKPGQVTIDCQTDQTTDKKIWYTTYVSKKPDATSERDKSEMIHETTNLCGKPTLADDLSDSDTIEEKLTHTTKPKWAKKVKIHLEKEKRPNCSRDNGDTGLSLIKSEQVQISQEADVKFRMKKSEQKSYQNENAQTTCIVCDTADSNTPTAIASDPKSREDSGEGEPTHCAKCQVLVLWNRILCVTVSVLLTFNCLRYSSVFFIAKSSTVHLISAITFQGFFLGVTLMYILSAYAMAKHLPRLLENLRKFEYTYGVSVDLDDFKRITKTRSRVVFTFQILFSLGFVLFEQFVFSSLQYHLTPFHTFDGVVFYFALITFALVAGFMNAFVCFLFGFMAISTFFLTLEFRNINSDFQKVLANPGTVLGLPTQDLPMTGCNTSVNFASSADRLDDGGSRRRRSLIQPSVSSDRFSSAVVSSHNGSDTHNDSQIISQSAHKDDRIQQVCEMSASSENTQSTFLASSHDEDLKLPGIVENTTEKRIQSLLDTRAKNDRSSNEDKVLSPIEFPATQTETQEAKFDILRGKHQMLCEIVAKTNQCVRHFVAIGFGGSFPLTCLIIYVLSSGSQDLANVLFLSNNLLYTVIFLAVGVVISFHVHDAAHAAQEVMYAADWSQFSDRLLTKVQLFASRLGHSQIGYDVYGLFVIDRSTVLMVVGTLVTYTVVVIQFQQAEVQQADVLPCVSGANTTAPP